MKLLLMSAIYEAAKDRPDGYVESVLAAGQVVRDENDEPLYVALADHAFEQLVAEYSPPDGSVASPGHGPGTEMKKLLASVGITATPNCKCNARAQFMDARGIEWCSDNIDEIVGWLREEATNRGLPFLDAAGRLLVRRAIRNARRAAAAN
jgi:hypothetical protein